MCMYMCTLTSSLGPAFRTARVVYRVISGYIHKGTHTRAAACGMLILFILECAAEECAANFNGVIKRALRDGDHKARHSWMVMQG